MVMRKQRYLEARETFLSRDAVLTDMKEKASSDIPSLQNILEAERSSCAEYEAAWTAADERYQSHVKENLSPEDAKRIYETLPEELPESIDMYPEYLIIAVIISTHKPNKFFGKFNSALHGVMQNGDWEAFPYKSLYILLDLATKHLPSRPHPKVSRLVFRGLKPEIKVVKGQEFCMAQFSPFTAKRPLAAQRQAENSSETAGKSSETAGKSSETAKKSRKGARKSAASAAAKTSETVEKSSEGAAANTSLPKRTIMRIKFDDNVQGLGVRHLSVDAGEEREVLISPRQMFRVQQIRENEKRRLKIVVLQPVK